MMCLIQPLGTSSLLRIFKLIIISSSRSRSSRFGHQLQDLTITSRLPQLQPSHRQSRNAFWATS
jgi:hypothetical protein